MWDNTLPKNRFLRFCVLMAHRCGCRHYFDKKNEFETVLV